MSNILLMGAGALALDLIDVFGAQAFAGAYVDPPFFRQADVGGVPVWTDWPAAVSRTRHFVLAISDLQHRERARGIATQAGLTAAQPMVSTMARIAATARLEPGCAVGHFCAVGPQAVLGPHCLLMHGVVIGHDSTLEDDVVVCAGAAVGGYVTVGARGFIGTNAVLAPRIKLGRDCHVAAGAACLRDAPDDSLLLGNPARRQARPGPDDSR